jgi:hypothetical protein
MLGYCVLMITVNMLTNCEIIARMKIISIRNVVSFLGKQTNVSLSKTTNEVHADVGQS